MIKVSKEDDRIPAAIEFCRKQIDDLDRKINGCNYVEDINGRLIRCDGSYSEERMEYEHEQIQWNIMLDILTKEAPFTQIDW